jgi:hypothetical protein
VIRRKSVRSCRARRRERGGDMSPKRLEFMSATRLRENLMLQETAKR